MQAEDLVAAVFPDQIACAENLAGDREVPDHPLVNQAVSDCLHEAMDIEGLERLLRADRIRRGPRRLLRPDPAVAARARGAVRPALRLSRRRAARGAADAGGDVAPLAGSAKRLRPRPSRSGGDRQSSLGGLARPGQRRGAARRAAVARLPDGGARCRRRRPGETGSTRWPRRSASPACGGRASRAPWAARRRPSRSPVDSGRAAEPVPRALARRAGSSRRSPPRRTRREKAWTREQALAEILRGRLEGLGPRHADRARQRRSGSSPARRLRRSPRSRPTARS